MIFKFDPKEDNFGEDQSNKDLESLKFNVSWEYSIPTCDTTEADTYTNPCPVFQKPRDSNLLETAIGGRFRVPSEVRTVRFKTLNNSAIQDYCNSVNHEDSANHGNSAESSFDFY